MFLVLLYFFHLICSVELFLAVFVFLVLLYFFHSICSVEQNINSKTQKVCCEILEALLMLLPKIYLW